MPLKGKNSQTNEEATVIDQFLLLRKWHIEKILICPLCDAPMVAVKDHYRMGAWVQRYLRHDSPCTTTYAHHPESPDHLAAKKWIGENIPALNDYGPVIVEYEARMPEIQRIADVCFTLPDGDRIVHEAQLAAINPDELEARTNDYQSLGYQIIWHFGKAANTDQNRNWAFRRLGGCEILTFEERTVAA